ncbi:MAG: hypothetical protein M1829_005199 [Trizodia sp. TS-e1964]|nr:MAG: hypothetical protein M1829_005199 [Trizodia sp. TS-e1964]
MANQKSGPPLPPPLARKTPSGIYKNRTSPPFRNHPAEQQFQHPVNQPNNPPFSSFLTMKSHLLLIAAIAGAASALNGFTFRSDSFPFYWNGENLHPIPQGIAFYAYEYPAPRSPADVIALYEIWNSATNELFYTADQAEIDNLHLLSGVIINKDGWQYGTDFIYCFAAQAGDPNRVQLWRSYNGHEHYYSINQAEEPAPGFHIEGPACWVYATAVNGAVPVYRWAV